MTEVDAVRATVLQLFDHFGSALEARDLERTHGAMADDQYRSGHVRAE